jgi:hypothetical protein
MSDQVKVFKNVNTQTATGAAHSVTLATTSSTQRAVIKEVNCKGVKNATLDLDGRTVATSTTDMVASGSLIMDVSSTLSLKFPYLPVKYKDTNFKGMFFSNGTDAMNYMERDSGPTTTGALVNMDDITQLSGSSNYPTNSSCAAYKGTDLIFYRYNSETVYEYTKASASPIAQYTFGAGHSLTTDGTYLYNIPNSTATSVINRRHIMSGTVDTITPASNVSGQGNNQGSFLLHHNGYLYTKNTGASGTMHIIKLSDMSVVSISSADVSGGYSDGGCIVQTKLGDAYVVEQGTSGWQWYKIGGTPTSFSNASGSSDASTEYGNAAVEVMPGIAFIFTEASDDLTIIDMNPSPPVWQHIASASSRTAAVSNAYGNYLSICGVMDSDGGEDLVIYDAYTSGVLISEGL